MGEGAVFEVGDGLLDVGVVAVAGLGGDVVGLAAGGECGEPDLGDLGIRNPGGGDGFAEGGEVSLISRAAPCAEATLPSRSRVAAITGAASGVEIVARAAFRTLTSV